MKKILLFILVAFCELSCSRYSPRLEAALSLAGGNRVELEKVLEHYRRDWKKYKAACFLIENMVGRYTLTSQKLDSLDAEFFDAVGNLDIRFEDTEVNVYLVQVRLMRFGIGCWQSTVILQSTIMEDRMICGL